MTVSACYGFSEPEKGMFRGVEEGASSDRLAERLLSSPAATRFERGVLPMCQSVSDTAPSVPYPIDERISLRARGRWRKGGLLKIYYDGQFKTKIEFRGRPWIVLSLLMDAAIRSVGSDPDDAFRIKEDLADGLAKHLGLSSKTRNRRKPRYPRRYVKNVVNLLRDVIEDGVTGWVDNPREWSRQLIEFHDTLGYRIGISPANLDLRVS